MKTFGSEIIDSLARNLQYALNECFSFLFFSARFIFFFCQTFSCRGKHQSPVCGSNTSSAQGASGKRGPYLLALFERRDVILAKQCVSSEKCAMPKALFVMMATKPDSQTKLSLQDFWLVVFLDLAKTSVSSSQNMTIVPTRLQTMTIVHIIFRIDAG